MSSLPFHLCQPGGGASCGACCGLYNFKDHSREALTHALDRHTERLHRTPKTPDDFANAARELKAQERSPAFPDVRVCPLLGFLDDQRSRVGCLAHPLVTGGVDLRDCGVYSASLCQSFECPSFIWLTASQAEWVRAACPDWYLYGLVITDVELVRGVLALIERELGEAVDARRILDCPAALRSTARLFALKERPRSPTTQQADQQPTIFGRFAPDDQGAPAFRTIDYSGLQIPPSPEDEVVLCLGFMITSAHSLEQARTQVREAVTSVVAALTSK